MEEEEEREKHKQIGWKRKDIKQSRGIWSILYSPRVGDLRRAAEIGKNTPFLLHLNTIFVLLKIRLRKSWISLVANYSRNKEAIFYNVNLRAKINSSFILSFQSLPLYIKYNEKKRHDICLHIEKNWEKLFFTQGTRVHF